MKLLIVADVHHRDLWTRTIAQESPDQVIFIGDYFDNQNIGFLMGANNFKEILKYRDDNPNTVLLTGNHCSHYLFRDRDEIYSGYQHTHVSEIESLLRDQTTMAYQYEDYILSHAGISEIWCKARGVDPKSETLVGDINTLWKNDKGAFKFMANMGRNFSNTGDDVTQSPIWIRPQSLIKCAVEYNQIVGHTQVKTITTAPNYNNKCTLTLIDTQSSSYGDQSYLTIIDGVLTTNYLKS